MRKIVLVCTALMMTMIINSAEPSIVKFPTFSVDGSLKSKLEYATRTDNSRFSVRSSRIGVQGYYNQYFSYRGQIEISDNGSFKPLDMYACFYPAESFTLSFGQRTVPVFNGYTVIPSELMFSNRAFLGKYLLGTRDIGMLGQYYFKIADMPSSVEFGIYNGSTINAPEWHNKPSYGGRFTLGNMKGWRTTIKFYDHDNSANNNIRYQVYGGDLRYESSRWRIESEVLMRKDKKDGEGDISSYYIQGAYIYPLNQKAIINNFIPALRYDGIDRAGVDPFNMNRLTFGLGFGLSPKYLSSIFRIDYEHFFVNEEANFMLADKTINSNKISVELLLKF